MITSTSYNNLLNRTITYQDKWRRDIVAKDDNQTIINLTDKEVRITLRESYDTTVKLEKVFTVDNAAAGTCHVIVDKTTTPAVDDYTNLTTRLYYYDVQVKDTSAGWSRVTIYSGTINFLPHVTQS